MRYTQSVVLRIVQHVLAVFLLSCSLARADVVADWNEIALNTVVASERHPALASRVMTTVHIAMFEVINFVEGGYVPRFLVKPPAPINVSSEAAVAAAVHHILLQLYPEQEGALSKALRQSTASIPDGQAKSSGLVSGRHLGGNIYAVRASEHAPQELGEAQHSDSACGVLPWNSIVTKLITAQRVKPIEAARLHALVSLAISDTDATGRDVRGRHDQRTPCVPSAIGTAVLLILESELSPTGALKTAVPDTATPRETRGLTQVRDVVDGRSSIPLSLGANHRTSLWAGDKQGMEIAMKALRNFAPIQAGVIAGDHIKR